jgi:hypothetical protein
MHVLGHNLKQQRNQFGQRVSESESVCERERERERDREEEGK